MIYIYILAALLFVALWWIGFLNIDLRYYRDVTKSQREIIKAQDKMIRLGEKQVEHVRALLSIEEKYAADMKAHAYRILAMWQHEAYAKISAIAHARKWKLEHGRVLEALNYHRDWDETILQLTHVPVKKREVTRPDGTVVIEQYADEEAMKARTDAMLAVFKQSQEKRK